MLITFKNILILELEPSCGNMFVGQPTLFGAGTWSKMNNVGQMKMFNDNTAQGFKDSVIRLL